MTAHSCGWLLPWLVEVVHSFLAQEGEKCLVRGEGHCGKGGKETRLNLAAGAKEAAPLHLHVEFRGSLGGVPFHPVHTTPCALEPGMETPKMG